MLYPVYTRPTEPLVEKNPYRKATYAAQPLPSFAEARALLPEPVLPDRPDWVGVYWRAWQLAWSHLCQPKRESGFVANFLGDPLGEHLFMWDTAFAMQFGLYGRRAFNFMGTLDNFYVKQHDDGFICREINMETGHDFFYPFDPNATGPNILAWAEWRYYRMTGDDGRISNVFWPLLAFHNWFRSYRTWPNGLYWATGLSSGMDNQPRVPNSQFHHRHWSWVDATAQAALNCQMLAQMATMLNEDETALALAREHEQLIALINENFWNEEMAFYQDRGPDGRFSPVKSIGAYWTLLDGDIVPEKRLEPFIRPLRENWAFKLPHRVPSLSADSEGYNAETGRYWRGAVWPALNFMVLRGLRTCGQHRLVHEIALNHLENVMQVYHDTGTLWENYAPETAAPGDPAQREFVGTTGITPIVLLLEDVIGITVEWPHRRVYFDRRLEPGQTCGVRNYPLGPEGTMSLIAEGETITLTTDVPLTLVYRDNTQTLQTAVASGASTIDLS